MRFEFFPLWGAASRGSRSTTATERPVRDTACAVARPTMPPPTTTTSNRGVGSITRSPGCGRGGGGARGGVWREVADGRDRGGVDAVGGGHDRGRFQARGAAGHGGGHRGLQRGEGQ